jgi:hypothetical protein
MARIFGEQDEKRLIPSQGEGEYQKRASVFVFIGTTLISVENVPAF